MLSCGAPSSAVRLEAYPPSFNYIERGQLRSKMWRLAKDVRALNEAMNSTSAEEINTILSRMELEALDLQKAGQKTNHPKLDENLDRFVAQVVGARKAAQAEPPNYFLAGTISGACMSCHH